MVQRVISVHHNTLEEDFTAEEIQTAISLLPPGKSPGPDGYTDKFYKVLAEDLTAPLLNFFNFITS